MDEPLASLDPMSAHEALQFFRWLANEGIAVILRNSINAGGFWVPPGTIPG